jgi:hypothetical protein
MAMHVRILTAVAVLVGWFSIPPTAQAQPYGDTIECASRDYQFTRCDVPWRDARLLRQTSDSHCIEGRTYGIDRHGLWVDKGCAGVFGRPGHHYGQGSGGGEWHPGPGWDTDIRFRCSSANYSYNMCQVDIGRGGRVYIEHQISNSPCVEGRTWGFHRGGVWVDQGCEANFVVERRWR